MAVAVALALALAVGAAQAAPSAKRPALATNGSCERSIIDGCATTLFVFGRRDVYLPQSFEEMVPHCQEEFRAEDCIKSFARKCLAPFERQVAGMLTLGAGQVLRRRCSRDGTREYLSHYKCIKRTLAQMHDAMDQLIYTLMAVSGQLEPGQDHLKIPTSCCAFARFQQVAGRIVQMGCGHFDKKAEDYISNKMIKGYVGDVLELSCQGYELASDKCAKIRLPQGGFQWQANGTLVRLPADELPAGAKPNSVVLPFLDIFTNL